MHRPAKSSSVFYISNLFFCTELQNLCLHLIVQIHNHKTHSLASLGNVFVQIFLPQVCCLMVTDEYKNGVLFLDNSYSSMPDISPRHLAFEKKIPSKTAYHVLPIYEKKKNSVQDVLIMSYPLPKMVVSIQESPRHIIPSRLS